eukprot:CAMPEP_0170187290 /NCGR_PEP_ID=MMETSP0040_2-20121228/41328_1 /TAXON_ID=641309 /ORGANISM="Lotharella oceanica, Strain CCMP622" /LENGTH=203 /DNA_ID=CAMNT_0010434291 /DNA_START=177 /DNA_END=791 /DNA_ORIENTATION=-
MTICLVAKIVTTWRPESVFTWYWKNPWNAFSVYFTVEIVVSLLAAAEQPQDLQFIAQSSSLLLVHMPGLCTILWYVSTILKQTLSLEQSSAVSAGIIYSHRSKGTLVFIISTFMVIFVTLVATCFSDVWLDGLVVNSKDLVEHVDATMNVLGMLFAAFFISRPRGTPHEQAESNASTVIEISGSDVETGAAGGGGREAVGANN